MDNFTSLGNHQLWIYYQVIEYKINEIQKTILEDIGDILGNIETNPEIYTNKEKFKAYCNPYRSTVEQEKKELLNTLNKQHNEIDKEMENRQRTMLKEVDIDTPSIRVLMIMKATRNTYFQAFSKMISYLKTSNEERIENRPENILLPESLIAMEEQTHTTILTIIQNNLWPQTKNFYHS